MRAIARMLAAMIVVASAAPGESAETLPPRLVVADAVHKDHLVTVIGANLIMAAGLGRSDVGSALSALDRHLAAQLRAGAPAVAYPEVVVSIVKAALRRGWSGREVAAVLADALAKIEAGRSPELVRQVVVLAITRDHKPGAVLVALALAAEANSAQ